MSPFLRLLLALACLPLALVAPASAQWNNFTVYDAPLQQLLNQSQMLGWQMQQSQQQIVQQNMNNPQVQALYQQHLMQGGRMSFEQFAYMYAATGGFSPQGIQNYYATSRQITAQEQQAYQGYLAAQRQRALAQRGLAEGFDRIMNESGHMLGGNSTYVHPGTGQPVVLPHVRPGEIHRDQAGQAYQMDNLGIYYVQAPNGLWYPMQPLH